jgi:hypothetical protein
LLPIEVAARYVRLFVIVITTLLILDIHLFFVIVQPKMETLQ